jgi:hypothetical protein
VYLARHRRLDRYCAVKVLRPEYAADPEFRARFEMEGRAASRLDHPNLVTIYDQGERGDVLFIVMQYIDGVTLKTLIDRGAPMPAERAIALLSQAAAALDAVHRAGLVHRDVKPENVLVRLRDGVEEVKLTDFGIASFSTGSKRLTTSYTGVLLTPKYASPERWRGDQGGAATDVYALACVLFECLSGRPPYLRENDAAYMAAHLTDAPPILQQIRRDLPRSLDGVLARGLAKSPEERWRSAGEMIAAARAALHARVGPVPPAPGRPAPPGPAAGRPARDIPTHRPGPRSPTPRVAPAQPGRGPAVTTVRPPVRGGRQPVFSRAHRVGFGVLAVLLACVGFTISRVGLASLSGSPSYKPVQPGATASPAAGAGIPIQSARPELSTWVAQLASVPVGDEQQLQDQYRRAQAAAGTVKVVRSDELPVWTPGFWVIYHVGAYADGHAVIQYCNSINRVVPNDCGGRFVSDNSADLFRYCTTLRDVAKCTTSRPQNS